MSDKQEYLQFTEEEKEIISKYIQDMTQDMGKVAFKYSKKMSEENESIRKFSVYMGALLLSSTNIIGNTAVTIMQDNKEAIRKFFDSVPESFKINLDVVYARYLKTLEDIEVDA